MSFTFKDSGLGLTEHAQALDRVTSILQTYFYGVIWAPCIFLSIGKEIEKLRDLIEKLINESAENKAPESEIFRSDNKLAAQKAVQLAFRGLDASLGNIENTIRNAKAHRDQTEKLWTIFAKKVQFSGDKSFHIALENFRYHNWAFELALRVLKRSNMEILFRTAQQSDQYLDELFAELFSSTGADSMDDALTSRFTEHADSNGRTFATDFRVEAILRISLYWAFKAIANISEIRISKKLSSEDCLNLFKAYWVFQRCREHPEADKIPRELQAMMVVIANELGFAAKTLLETAIELPPLDDLVKCDNFQIWLEEDVDDQCPTPPRTPTSLQTPDSPISQKSLVDEDINGPQIRMSKTAVHPAAYSTYEGYRDDLSQGGGHYSGSSSKSNGMGAYSKVNRKPVAVTPQTSATDSQRRASTGQASNSARGSSHSLNGSHDGGSQPKAKPIGGGITRSATVTDSVRWGVPLLEEPRPREGSLNRGSSILKRQSEYSPAQSHHSPLGSSLGRSTSNESSPHPASAPFSPDFIYPVSPEFKGFRPEATITEPPDYGVRPGESEIMKQRSLASNTCDVHSKWDECVVRIFRNGAGDLRILTLREARVDQRFVTPKDNELIPEYGYHIHENLPVVFIRKAGSSGYSLQSGKQSKRVGSTEPSPASLYYKFRTIMDMFEFQSSLLGETVLADVQVVRAVRYKRGMLDGETSTNYCRVQIWKEQNAKHRSASISSGTGSVSGTFRARPKQSMLKPRSTRIVMFLGKILVSTFITDDITIEENTRSLIVKIKPASHRTLSGRSSVKACIMGNRDLSGGIRLDKEGILIEDEERFDDFKWFEIDFQTPAEMNVFTDEFREALQERRRERREIDELKRKAANGVKAG